MSAEKILLLITDLDGTLVGDDEATEKLNQWLQLPDIRKQVYLVYSTGRSYESTHRLKDEKSLLEPDRWVTAVGTEIYFDGKGTLDKNWAEKLDKNWDRQIVARIMNKHFSNLLEKQPNKEDRRKWKVSFHLKDSFFSKDLKVVLSEREEDLLEKVRKVEEDLIEKLGKVEEDLLEKVKRDLSGRALSKALRELKPDIAHAQVISGRSSSLREEDNKMNVDIVPEIGNKGGAANHIREELSKEKTLVTVVCGDSGNDISFFEPIEKDKDWYGVIVGNALPELLDWYQDNKIDKPHLYKANSHCAQGIIEGLDYFIARGMMPELKQSWKKHFKFQAISEA